MRRFERERTQGLAKLYEDQSATDITSPRVSLVLGGDVMTGRGIDQILRHPGDPRLYEQGTRSALDYVRLAEERNGPIPRSVGDSYIWGDALAAMDAAGEAVRIINLETAVTDRGEPWPGKGIHYRMHPANVGCITAARIDSCIVANNHILDWSYEGFAQTLDVLTKAGLLPVGAGPDTATASRPVVIDLRAGLRVVVVAIGTTSSGIPGSWAARPGRPGVTLAPTLSSAQVDAVTAQIAAVAKADDLVVASMHWGPNWGYEIPAAHRQFARALIDGAGVHVVHGHSSHHPLGIELYRDRPILYGCGDLINDYEGIHGQEAYRPGLGLLYRLTLDPARGCLEEMELIPVHMRRFRLVLASTEQRMWLRQTLTREGRRFGTVIEADEEGRLFVSS